MEKRGRKWGERDWNKREESQFVKKKRMGYGYPISLNQLFSILSFEGGVREEKKKEREKGRKRKLSQRRKGGGNTPSFSSPCGGS